MADTFTEIVIQDRVKVAAHRLGYEVISEIARVIRERYEGRCSRYGYVMPESAHVTYVSAGRVEAFSLHGSVVYDVSAICRVCNPAPGCVLRCTVMNMNDFGVLAVWGYKEPDTAIFVPVVEVVVPVTSAIIENNPEVLRKLSIGATVAVEILGKKFTHADRKINAIGRIVHAGAEQRVVYDRVHGYAHGSSARDPESGVFLDAADLYDDDEDASDIDKDEPTRVLPGKVIEPPDEDSTSETEESEAPESGASDASESESSESE